MGYANFVIIELSVMERNKDTKWHNFRTHIMVRESETFSTNFIAMVGMYTKKMLGQISLTMILKLKLKPLFRKQTSSLTATRKAAVTKKMMRKKMKPAGGLQPKILLWCSKNTKDQPAFPLNQNNYEPIDKIYRTKQWLRVMPLHLQNTLLHNCKS